MKNRITEILGSKYPIIQGAMRLITPGGGTAAAVSRSGAFGIIAASGLDGDRLRAEIWKARSLTDNPFGINIPSLWPWPKKALRNYNRIDIIQTLDHERLAHSLCWNTEDRQEGMKSFVEKPIPCLRENNTIHGAF